MVLPFVKKECKRINCILPETKYRSFLGAGPTFKHSLQFASVILLLNRFRAQMSQAFSSKFTFRVTEFRMML